MIKNVIQYKKEIEGKEHIYHCEFECPTSQVKDFALDLIHWAKQIEDNQAAQAELEKSVQVDEVADPMPGVESAEHEVNNVDVLPEAV